MDNVECKMVNGQTLPIEGEMSERQRGSGK